MAPIKNPLYVLSLHAAFVGIHSIHHSYFNIEAETSLCCILGSSHYEVCYIFMFATLLGFSYHDVCRIMTIVALQYDVCRQL